MAGRSTLKSYFETGDFPTQSQFASFIDDTFNLTDDLGSANQIAYVNGGATNLAFSSNLSFDGSDLTVNGNILSATWQGNAIADAYIASAATWNGKQDALTFGIANTNSVVIDSVSVTNSEYARFTASGLESRSFAEVKTDLSLNNVENTALSTWGGSSNITTLGTITTGTWEGTAISDTYISSAATWNAKVGTSGTPADDQVAVFTNSSTVEGSDNFRYDATKTSLVVGTDINFSSGGSYSFSGGKGFSIGSKEILASGQTAFNFSENNPSQTSGYGALAAQSAILGGQNHHITANSVRAGIFGGELNQITGTSSRSIITGGQSNTLDDALSCSIIGGQSNTFSTSSTGSHTNSSIISSVSSTITNTTASSMFYNTILGGSNNAITDLTYVNIIGGDTITADQDYTTYIENLCLQADRFVYVGMPLTNGSWRVGGDGVSSVVFARRESGTYNTKFTIDDSGALVVASITDVAAPNSSLYYSTTQARLVYKDSGGTVNNLY